MPAREDGTERRTETAQTLSRGLDVLSLLAASREGLTLAQVSAELGLSRTIVYRLVSTLIVHHLVRRSDDGVLHVGLGVLTLASNLHPMLREGTRDVLQRLSDELGATSHLVIVEGDEGVALSVVEPSRSQYHVAYRVGSRFPLSQGGHGRAILLARRGRWEYISSRGELLPGVYGVSAAVPGLDQVELAVGVISPVPLDTKAVGARVIAATREIAAGL